MLSFEAHLETLVLAYLDGDIPKEMYLKRKDTLMRSTLALKEKMQDFVHGRNNWVEPLREWVKDTKQATFLSSSTNFKEIAFFVQKIGTNHTVRDKTARFGVPVPSAFVAKQCRIFSSLSSRAASPRSLTSSEVSFCAHERDRGRTFITQDDILSLDKLLRLMKESTSDRRKDI